MEDTENIGTFVDLYKRRCQMDGEEPLHVPLYEDLDKLLVFIEQNDSEKKPIKKALSDDREYVAIPYEMFEEKRLPPDDITENGTEVAFASPGLDVYKSLVIDQMNNSYGVDLFDDDLQMLTFWKLRRVAKVVNYGWDSYVSQYLSQEETVVETKDKTD